MPRENKISSTFPFLYDRQRQEMGDQNKGGGGVRKQHIPHKLTTNLDISRLKTQKKQKAKPQQEYGGGGCFAAVVAEDCLVYNLRSTGVPRSATQTTERIQRQADRQTD